MSQERIFNSLRNSRVSKFERHDLVTKASLLGRLSLKVSAWELGAYGRQERTRRSTLADASFRRFTEKTKKPYMYNGNYLLR